MSPGSVESVRLTSCRFRWAGVHLLELDGRAHGEGVVSPLPVVEDLQVLEDRVGQLDPRAPPTAVQQVDLHPGQNDSTMALSKQSPVEPIEGRSPDRLARSVNAQEVNWVPWSEWMSVAEDGRRL